jgi:hypothetical protein
MRQSVCTQTGQLGSAEDGKEGAVKAQSAVCARSVTFLSSVNAPTADQSITPFVRVNLGSDTAPTGFGCICSFGDD